MNISSKGKVELTIMTKQQIKDRGFTIIEVVLVLAIAALIFLMVFIALPALQASQRDTARKNDVSIVSAAYNSALSNNRGGSVDTDRLKRFVSGISENTSPDNISVAGFSDSITVKDAQIIVVVGARCGESNTDGQQKLTRGTRRQYATFTRLEAGNHAAYCLDS